MDYRYETKPEAREFHAKRKALIIHNEMIDFLPDNSAMSHFEYCQTKGITRDEFNQIIRGYYLDNNLVFYKDNFIYDKDLIEKSLCFVDSIAEMLSIDNFNIYFGLLVEENFKFDLLYGKYEHGVIVKETTKQI